MLFFVALSNIRYHNGLLIRCEISVKLSLNDRSYVREISFFFCMYLCPLIREMLSFRPVISPAQQRIYSCFITLFMVLCL